MPPREDFSLGLDSSNESEENAPRERSRPRALFGRFRWHGRSTARHGRSVDPAHQDGARERHVDDRYGGAPKPLDAGRKRRRLLGGGREADELRGDLRGRRHLLQHLVNPY